MANVELTERLKEKIRFHLKEVTKVNPWAGNTYLRSHVITALMMEEFLLSDEMAFIEADIEKRIENYPFWRASFEEGIHSENTWGK